MADAERAVPRPRVLHVFGSLTFGGIETWLVHIFRHQAEAAVQHEVLLMKDEIGPYEAEVRALGIPVHRLPMRGGKLGWLPGFRRFLADEGPFAAVHSHVSLFSSAVLSAARRAGVPVRIAHCHDARSKGRPSLRQRLTRSGAIAWLKRSATRRIGISEASIEEISGAGWREDPHSSILLYGFDFSRNDGAAERATALRKALGIGEKAAIIGHIGRFDPVKNHAFLLQAFAALAKTGVDAHLVLVGEGPILDAVKAEAAALPVAEKVHFAGATGDVPAYMAMFDLFLLPSFSEGLGIVVLEAQAAGTRALVSDAVQPEVSVVAGAVERLPLAAGPAAWAAAMARLLLLPAPDAAAWRRQIEASRFGIGRCIDELNQIYLAEMQRNG